MCLYDGRIQCDLVENEIHKISCKNNLVVLLMLQFRSISKACTKLQVIVNAVQCNVCTCNVHCTSV